MPCEAKIREDILGSSRNYCIFNYTYRLVNFLFVFLLQLVGSVAPSFLPLPGSLLLPLRPLLLSSFSLLFPDTARNLDPKNSG
jgi:hypothetical protein